MGDFYNILGEPRSSFAAINASTLALQAIDIPIDDFTYGAAFDADDNNLYMMIRNGNSEVAVNAYSRSTGNLLTTLTTLLNTSYTTDVLADGSNLYLTGGFSLCQGRVRTYFCAINKSTGALAF
ncbi:hypothetical protein D3C86_1919060 [compost metagenome]